MSHTHFLARRRRLLKTIGDGRLNAQDLAAGIVGAVVKDPVQDKVVWNEYLETVVKTREDWKDVYRACKEINM